MPQCPVGAQLLPYNVIQTNRSPVLVYVTVTVMGVSSLSPNGDNEVFCHPFIQVAICCFDQGTAEKRKTNRSNIKSMNKEDLLVILIF
jgi:hypothetical protein